MAQPKENMFSYIEETLKPMSLEECKKMYSDWGAEYEKDMPGRQYYAYEGAAKGFLELNLPKDIKILDCGAGTGLLGAQLVERGGYTNIDALDGCEQMLEVAKKRNIYKKIFVTYVTPDKELPIAEGSYDVLVMVGVFCPGHFPMQIDTFKQLLRIVKKGGIMAWGMANPDRYADRDETYANQGFQKILQKLAEDGIIQVIEGHPKEYSNYFKGENGFFYAVRKL